MEVNKRMRKNTTLVIILALVVVVMFAAASFAEMAKKMGPQVNCPVSGMKIDKKYYADYEGKRVYFCSSMCKPAFDKDPAKYMKVLADKGEQPEAAPAVNAAAAPSGK